MAKLIRPPVSKLMIYAIGDIHGCRVALETMIARLNLSTEDTVICLGDYLDRGPDSKGVVDALLQLQSTHNLIHLRGNHEVSLMRAAESQEGLDFFCRELVGGLATIRSYGDSLDDIPARHWQFLLEDSLLYYETDTHIFVHGGLNAEMPLAQQCEELVTTKRFITPCAHFSGKTMICGHTVQGDLPTQVGDHSICLDTCAFGGGWLTALEVETGLYHQTNEQGEYRQGELG